MEVKLNSQTAEWAPSAADSLSVGVGFGSEPLRPIIAFLHVSQSKVGISVV